MRTKEYFYFAYGSNLLEERVVISIPDVRFKCRAMLKDYKLVFSGPETARWHGSVANILPCENRSVYGVVYTITPEDLERLDDQEGVAFGHYARLLVNVCSLDDQTTIECITYEKGDKNEVIDKPSPAYKNVIINGAKKAKLPEDYIEYLRSFEDNGYRGDIGVNLSKELYCSS